MLLEERMEQATRLELAGEGGMLGTRTASKDRVKVGEARKNEMGRVGGESWRKSSGGGVG